MAGIILSADIGTSSLKAAYIDFDGRLLAFSRVVYPCDSAGTVGADDWERAFALTLENLHELAPDCVPDGVCISGNGPTLAPVTNDGETLPPLFWHDSRMVLPEAGSQTQADLNKRQSFFLPHAAWFMKSAPADYEKTRYFVSSHEWLAARLGAETLTVLPRAAYEPYFWDDGQCRLFGLDRDKFPPFVQMGSIMGKVSAQAASQFGSASGNCLKSGTPIVSGGPDYITALIGTGTMRPGDVCDRAGSSEGINVCASGPAETQDTAGGNNLTTKVNSFTADGGITGDGLRVVPHFKEGLWNIGAVISASGTQFEWYRNLSGQRTRDYDEQLAELIPSTDTDLFSGLESLCQTVKRPLPPNASFSTTSSSLELGRAVLCDMAFAVRHAAQSLAARGFPVREMRVSGGQARNPRWNQLKADITGISLVIPEISDGELAGNAVLAAAALDESSVSSGADSEWALEGAAARMIRFREQYMPHNAAYWEDKYLQYLK